MSDEIPCPTCGNPTVQESNSFECHKCRQCWPRGHGWETRWAEDHSEQPQGQVGATAKEQTESEQRIDEAIEFLEQSSEENWAEAVRELRDKAQSSQPNAVKLAIEALKGCISGYELDELKEMAAEHPGKAAREISIRDVLACAEALTALSESSETRDGARVVTIAKPFVSIQHNVGFQPDVIELNGRWYKNLGVEALETYRRKWASAAMRNDGGVV